MDKKTLRTLEFLLVVLTNLAGWLAVVANELPHAWGIYISAVSGAVYALARGAAKENADTKDYWHTTEFWFNVAMSIPAVIGAFASTINPQTYAIIQGLIVAALAVANGKRKDPDVAAGNISASQAQAADWTPLPALPMPDQGDAGSAPKEAPVEPPNVPPAAPAPVKAPARPRASRRKPTAS